MVWTRIARCLASIAFWRSALFATEKPADGGDHVPDGNACVVGRGAAADSGDGDADVGLLDRDAEVGVLHRAAADQLRHDRATVFEGIAKPMPSLPPESLAICAFTPITSPSRSRSGPPELPWLIAASVWIESLIVKPFGAYICRCSALTIPLVAVCSSPSGLPIATTSSPTVSESESPSSSGSRSDAGASTSMTARSVEGSLADDAGVVGLAVPERHPTRRPRRRRRARS